MTDIKNLLSSAWDSMLGRAAILAAAVGWVPFVLLTMAHNAIKN
jgi:hypothetical protein